MMLVEVDEFGVSHWHDPHTTTTTLHLGVSITYLVDVGRFCSIASWPCSTAQPVAVDKALRID